VATLTKKDVRLSSRFKFTVSEQDRSPKLFTRPFLDHSLFWIFTEPCD